MKMKYAALLLSAVFMTACSVANALQPAPTSTMIPTETPTPIPTATLEIPKFPTVIPKDSFAEAVVEMNKVVEYKISKNNKGETVYTATTSDKSCGLSRWDAFRLVVYVALKEGIPVQNWAALISSESRFVEKLKYNGVCLPLRNYQGAYADCMCQIYRSEGSGAPILVHPEVSYAKLSNPIYCLREGARIYKDQPGATWDVKASWYKGYEGSTWGAAGWKGYYDHLIKFQNGAIDIDGHFPQADDPSTWGQEGIEELVAQFEYQ